MSELDPTVSMLLRGQIHFGQVEVPIQDEIIGASKQEILEARATGQRVSPPGYGWRSPVSEGELAGRHTQALIIGNMGAISLGVDVYRSNPNRSKTDQFITRDDLFAAAVSMFGNTVLAYDREKGKNFGGYALNRAKAVAQRLLLRANMRPYIPLGIDDDPAMEESLILPEDDFDGVETHLMVDALPWDKLTPTSARTLKAHYLNGVNVLDIAQAEGVTKQAIFHRLNTGIERLRPLLPSDPNDLRAA